MTMRAVFCLGAFYEDGLSQVCEIKCRHLLLSFNLDRSPVSSLARDSLPEKVLSNKCGDGKEET